jgi:hypothetical protein
MLAHVWVTRFGRSCQGKDRDVLCARGKYSLRIVLHVRHEGPSFQQKPPPLDVAHREAEGGSKSAGSSLHCSICPKGMDDGPDEPQKEH